MAAPRATQFIALRNLARGSHQVRHLHMTGPATYPSSVLTKERPVLNLPRDIASLRAECKKRKIDPSGSQHELLDRLNADELTHSRAFSTAIEHSKRPAESPETPTHVRHFNTSRSLKAVGDASTIDFAYLPSGDVETEAPEIYRVPILPNNYTATVNQEEEVVPAMGPQVSSMSADAVFLPMSDLSDGHAMNIDFHAMADRVAANLRQLKVPAEEQASLMKQLWSDLVDDMVGARKTTPS